MTLRKSIFPLIALAATLCACEEEIRPEDRYKPAPVVAQRMVLIEEYTGMDCPNCPAGHSMLQQIETLYNTPDNAEAGVGVIAVGIHIPNFGYSVNEGGLVAPEADQLAPGQKSAPAARFNRTGSPINTDLWQTEVAKRIIREPKITFNPVMVEMANGKITVSGQITSLSSSPIDDAILHVWIVEDDIVGEQMLANGTYDDNYVHHAVYRASANGLKGETIHFIPRGSVSFTTAPYPLHPAWNPAKLRAVVFVETESEGVLNATQGHSSASNQ